MKSQYKSPKPSDWPTQPNWTMQRSKAQCTYTHETCTKYIDGIPTRATIEAVLDWSIAANLGLRHETYRAWNPHKEQYCRFDTLPEAAKWAVEQ